MSTPSDLASAAKCYCFDDATERSIIVYLLLNGATNMTPSELAIAAKSYSYDLDTWKKVVVYLLDGNGADTPNALAEASKCFCFDNGSFKRIVAYLLNKGGGGGPCPQDMQVAWTPTTTKLGEQLGLFTFGDLPGPITNIVWDVAQNIAGVDIETSSVITTFSAPLLTAIDPTNLQSGYLSFQSNTGLSTLSFPLLSYVSGSVTIRGNPSLLSVALPSLTHDGASLQIRNNAALTSIDLSGWVPVNTQSYAFDINALQVATVNQVLARAVANAGYVFGTINLDGGTNAAPAGQGIADKATLIGRGVAVITN